MRDSKYTSPEALMGLYQQPRDPLKDLDDVNAVAAQVVQTQAPPSAISGGGAGSGGNPGGGTGSVLPPFRGGGFHKLPPTDDPLTTPNSTEATETQHVFDEGFLK